MNPSNEELVKAGIMEAREGLKPSSEGVRVRFSGTDRIVRDGPFTAKHDFVERRYGSALSDGGTVDLPLGPTFWSPKYGMVTDKFDVGWMVMVRRQQQ